MDSIHSRLFFKVGTDRETIVCTLPCPPPPKPESSGLANDKPTDGQSTIAFGGSP